MKKSVALFIIWVIVMSQIAFAQSSDVGGVQGFQRSVQQSGENLDRGFEKIATNIEEGQPGLGEDIQLIVQSYEPSTVRANFIENRNVVVYALLRARQINPTITVPRINSILVRTAGIKTYPEGMPVRIGGIRHVRPSGGITWDNLGYLKIPIRQIPREADVPENIEIKLDIRINFDISQGPQVGSKQLVLQQQTQEEWSDSAEKNEFYAGYVRAREITSKQVVLTVYDENFNVIRDGVTIQEGRRTGSIRTDNFRGRTLFDTFRITLDDIREMKDTVSMEVWKSDGTVSTKILSEGEDIAEDSIWEVKKISVVKDDDKERIVEVSLRDKSGNYGPEELRLIEVFSEVKSDTKINETKSYPDDYKNAIDSYKAVADSYGSVDYDDSSKYGARALLAIAEIHQKLGAFARAYETYNEILKDYPQDEISKTARQRIKNIEDKKDYKDAQRTLREGGRTTTVRLLGYSKASSKQDAKAKFYVKKERTSTSKEVSEGSYIETGGTRVLVKKIRSNNVYVTYDSGGFTIEKVIDVGKNFKIDGDTIEIGLLDVDLKREAKVTINPDPERAVSEDTLVLHIPIEKRPLDLPLFSESLDEEIFKTQELIAKLDKVVTDVERVHETWIKLCYLTYGILLVTNFMGGLFGSNKAAVRKRVNDKWRDKWENDIDEGRGKTSFDQYLINKADEYDKDIENAAEIWGEIEDGRHESVGGYDEDKDAAIREHYFREKFIEGKSTVGNYPPNANVTTLDIDAPHIAQVSFYKEGPNKGKVKAISHGAFSYVEYERAKNGRITGSKVFGRASPNNGFGNKDDALQSSDINTRIKHLEEAITKKADTYTSKQVEILREELGNLRQINKCTAAIDRETTRVGRIADKVVGVVGCKGQSFTIKNFVEGQVTGTCTDYMSPTACKTLFEVCDPVICPVSRYPIAQEAGISNVVQSGIIGSLVLGQGNGNTVPVCITGVLAGLKNIKTVLESYNQCLNIAKVEGRSVGLCDRLRSFYICDILWKEAITTIKALSGSFLGKSYSVLNFALGRESGGGEYTNFNQAIDNSVGSLNFFTQDYAKNVFAAYSGGSLGEIGTEVCKNAIYGKVPGVGDVLDQITRPESPPQFTAFFDEIPLSDIPRNPQSEYEVFYHFYSGDNPGRTGRGVTFSVYLRNRDLVSDKENLRRLYIIRNQRLLPGQFKSCDRNECIVQGISGYKEICISYGSDIYNDEVCGFGKVSTTYGVNKLTDEYVKDQIEKTTINSEEQCTGALTGNLLSGGTSTGEKGARIIVGTFSTGLLQTGLVRVCSAKDNNPGIGANRDNWQIIGSCGEDDNGRDLGACWLYRPSAEASLVHKDAQKEAIGKLDERQVTQKEAAIIVETLDIPKIREFVKTLTLEEIDEILDSVDDWRLRTLRFFGVIDAASVKEYLLSLSDQGAKILIRDYWTDIQDAVPRLKAGRVKDFVSNLPKKQVVIPPAKPKYDADAIIKEGRALLNKEDVSEEELNKVKEKFLLVLADPARDVDKLVVVSFTVARVHRKLGDIRLDKLEKGEPIAERVTPKEEKKDEEERVVEKTDQECKVSVYFEDPTTIFKGDDVNYAVEKSQACRFNSVRYELWKEKEFSVVPFSLGFDEVILEGELYFVDTNKLIENFRSGIFDLDSKYYLKIIHIDNEEEKEVVSRNKLTVEGLGVPRDEDVEPVEEVPDVKEEVKEEVVIPEYREGIYLMVSSGYMDIVNAENNRPFTTKILGKERAKVLASRSEEEIAKMLQDNPDSIVKKYLIEYTFFYGPYFYQLAEAEYFGAMALVEIIDKEMKTASYSRSLCKFAKVERAAENARYTRLLCEIDGEDLVDPNK